MDSNDSHNDDDKQTSKTKYTNYSMTSSVIRRNQGLQNIDDHFDKVFDEYDDQEIGPLDSRHINEQGASIEDDLVQQTVDQFEKQQMQTYDFIFDSTPTKTFPKVRVVSPLPIHKTFVSYNNMRNYTTSRDGNLSYSNCT
jgi:hypothetical protein